MYVCCAGMMTLDDVCWMLMFGSGKQSVLSDVTPRRCGGLGVMGSEMTG